MDPNEYPSCIGVQWKIKKPKFGDWFRTPYFRLRDCELCLELLLKCQLLRFQNEEIRRHIEVKVLCRRKPSDAKTKISTSCYITAGSIVYFDYANLDYLREHNSVFFKEVEISDYPSLDTEEEWIVFCQLGCEGYSFENEVSKKRIRLSTVDDTLPSSSVNMCVQGSSKITDALSCDYARLFEQEMFPDFKLSCGDQTFSVHRCVLASRSEVFRAMFTNQTQEVKAGLAVIEDLEMAILELLLKFIYSGQLEDISVETAARLYEAADKYAVKSLMTACSYYMIRNVTVENCVGYLKTADAHSDPDLKAAFASFIIRHPGVFKSDSWATFLEQQPMLANEVLQTYIVSLNP